MILGRRVLSGLGRSRERRVTGLTHAEMKDRVVALQEANRTLNEARLEARAIVAASEEKAAEIAAAADKARDALIAEARKTAGRAANEIRRDAKHTARAIIHEAEKRGHEITAAAELARARAERELALQATVTDETRRHLASFIRDLLDEVQRAPDGLARERPHTGYGAEGKERIDAALLGPMPWSPA